MMHMHSSKYLRKIRTYVFVLLLTVSAISDVKSQFPAEYRSVDLFGHVLAEMTLKMDVTPLDTVVIDYFDTLKFRRPMEVVHVVEKYYNGKLEDEARWRSDKLDSRHVYYHNEEGMLSCIVAYPGWDAQVAFDMRKSTEDSTEHYWIDNKVKYRAIRDGLGRLSEFKVTKAINSNSHGDFISLFGYPHYLGIGYDEYYRIKYTYSGFLKNRTVIEQLQDSTNQPFDIRRVDLRNRRGELISEKLSYIHDGELHKKYDILKCRKGYLLQMKDARIQFSWKDKKTIEMSIDDGKGIEIRTYRVHVI
jgi:hypothetical protein